MNIMREGLDFFVPLSPFMMTQMRDPTHLSMSSVGEASQSVGSLFSFRFSKFDHKQGESVYWVLRTCPVGAVAKPC